ncbi:MAG: HEPN domain-containing protein [bacterium]
MKEIDDLAEKAKRFLRTAELSLNDGDYDSCVSRCYYAMFLTTEALLLTQNLRASSHKGVITLFGERFIKTDLMRKELGKMLRRAYDLRQKGDYGILKLALYRRMKSRRSLTLCPWISPS